jgi:hypothetical protein
MKQEQMEGPAGARRATRVAGAVGLAVVLLAGACSGQSREGGASGSGGRPTIKQPVVLGDPPVAPQAERVDIGMPSFSDPTTVTNPLHPTAVVDSALLLGTVDGKAFRTEVTLLPETRFIEWNGRPVETLVSQYVAFLDGRIHEVAYDFYAQADDGSVWYFGEDVFNFRNGVIADTHGTWIAGRDGPPAMIMPASPQVGDTYRPENIPGFVFEEVTVQSVGRRLAGPLGSIDGGLVVQELHMDGGYEDKTFAPGYGEFFTAAGGDVEALALAVPTDAASGPLPEELVTLSTEALAIVDAARAGQWEAASTRAEEMAGAWAAHDPHEVPRMIEPRMSRNLRALAAAVDARDSERTRQAAIDTARWAFDLQLRHRAPQQIDLARFDLWAAQLQLDADAGDRAAVTGDLFTLDYIRDRIHHVLDGATLTRINTALEELQVAVGDGDLAAAADAAGVLREILRGVIAG